MLTDEQYNFFQQQGYLVINDVIDQKTILDPLRKDYENLINRLVDGWVAEGKMNPPAPNDNFYDKLLQAYQQGCEWFQPMDISLPRADKTTKDTPMHLSEPVFNLLKCPKLLDIMEQLLGGEITSNPIQHVRLKPPVKQQTTGEEGAHVAKTEFHQDRGVAHESGDNSDVITCWVAVEDATVENGCLQVIPNWTDNKLVPHCPINGQLAIAKDFIEEEKAVPLPVKSGGVVLFHPLTPHASLENHSDKFRWSFDIRFNRTGQSTGRDHFPSFIARSRNNPETELTDWTVFRDNWEKTRDKLAKEKEHTPAHRWTADASPCA